MIQVTGEFFNVLSGHCHSLAAQVSNLDTQVPSLQASEAWSDGDNNWFLPYCREGEVTHVKC